MLALALYPSVHSPLICVRVSKTPDRIDIRKSQCSKSLEFAPSNSCSSERLPLEPDAITCSTQTEWYILLRSQNKRSKGSRHNSRKSLTYLRTRRWFLQVGNDLYFVRGQPLPVRLNNICKLRIAGEIIPLIRIRAVVI